MGPNKGYLERKLWFDKFMAQQSATGSNLCPVLFFQGIIFLKAFFVYEVQKEYFHIGIPIQKESFHTHISNVFHFGLVKQAGFLNNSPSLANLFLKGLPAMPFLF